MSVNAARKANEPPRTRVLEISDFPVSDVQRYARQHDGVYFERRGGRTFLIADR